MFQRQYLMNAFSWWLQQPHLASNINLQMYHLLPKSCVDQTLKINSGCFVCANVRERTPLRHLHPVLFQNKTMQLREFAIYKLWLIIAINNVRKCYFMDDDCKQFTKNYIFLYLLHCIEIFIQINLQRNLGNRTLAKNNEVDKDLLIQQMNRIYLKDFDYFSDNI